jgi:adenylylsulfate kinase
MLDGMSHVPDAPPAVPVLLFTGPTGAGKSTVAAEAARLLEEAGIPHAMVDLAVIAQCSPRPADDPWNERLVHRNLACMWRNFRQAGAGRLILCRVLEDRSLLRYIAKAVPGAQITVIRLTAEFGELSARIRSREAGRDPQWYLDTAAYLVDKLDRCAAEDHVVSNQDRPAAAAAAEALRLVGWLTRER